MLVVIIRDGICILPLNLGFKYFSILLVFFRSLLFSSTHPPHQSKGINLVILHILPIFTSPSLYKRMVFSQGFS